MISGGMAAVFKIVTALYIALLCIFALTSQATPINYKSTSGFTPPCGENRPENCVTHRPVANEHQRPCNPSYHCRGGGYSLAGSENVNKAQVSAATKQLECKTILVLQWILDRCSFFFVLMFDEDILYVLGRYLSFPLSHENNVRLFLYADLLVMRLLD
ncbi:hypothetical protein CRYUN_Cryun22dG0100000 [Craigia yunnanensis]